MSILALQKKEILQLLKDYNLTDYVDEVKEWYDGYLFGNIEIYNPWSTLMYVDCKLNRSDTKPTHSRKVFNEIYQT